MHRFSGSKVLITSPLLSERTYTYSVDLALASVQKLPVMCTHIILLHVKTDTYQKNIVDWKDCGAAAMKLLALLVLLVGHDILALLLNQRIYDSRRYYRFQFAAHEGQATYDPFESDATMRAMLATELSSVKLMNSSNIKLELRSLGYSSKGFVDRFELEKFLARKRTTNKLNVAQGSAEIEKMKIRRASKIDAEIKNIEASGMTDLSIVKELHSLKIKFDVSEDLSQQLALARLGIFPASSADTKLQDENNSDESKVIANTVADLRDVYTRFVQNVEGIIPNTTINSDFLLHQDIFSETLKTVQKYAGNIGLTESEQEAQMLTTGKAQKMSEGEPTSKVFKDTMAEGVLLNASQLMNTMELAKSIKSFDEIVLWAKNKSRSELAQLLEYQKESIPKYATRSALAAILADSILVERTNEENDHTQDAFRRNFVANSKIDQRDQVPTNIKDMKSAQSASEDYRVRNERKIGDTRAGRTRLDGSRHLTSFFFEKELLKKFSDRVMTALKDIVSQDILDDLTTGGSQKSFTSFVSRTINLCCRSTITLAVWAGGKSFLPSHVIFIATLYSLLSKKGILCFIGSFLVIRIFREIAFVRDTFTDQSVPSVTR